MKFERIINLALWAYPRELRESRGAEIRDTALEASGESRVKLLRESLALANAGMSARARAVASSVLGTNTEGTLHLRAIAYRVARAYAGAWRSLLAASALLFLTNAVHGWSVEQTAVPTTTPTVSAIVAVVTLIVWVVALAFFAAFVISRGTSIGREGSDGVRAALSMARAAAGEMALILFIGTISLAVAASLPKALGVTFGVSAHHGGVTGGGITGTGGVVAGMGVAGTLTFIALLTIGSVALPVVVIENLGSMRSFARSRALIRGNRLRAAVVVTIVVALAEAARLLARLLTGAVGEIGEAIVWLPVIPVPLLAATALYLELDEHPPIAAMPLQPGEGPI